MVFQYNSEAHQRRHGPQGYRDYRSFKPWLRDEFAFQCVYCLWRENWCGDGDSSFSVEHLYSQVEHPERTADYENLLYACCRCNSFKQSELVLDPCLAGWGRHIEVGNDGIVVALTAEGGRLIEVCRLNRHELVRARQRITQLLDTLEASSDSNAQALFRHYRGFPDNLPQLSKLKPPNGNTRPEGLASSYFEQRERGELPEVC
jgi:hypothetical protein